MNTLIRGATILAMGGENGTTPFDGDILINGDSIAQIGKGLAAPDGCTLIDGRGKLVMPGLVNSHLHSAEALFKGRYDNMPLEIWMLYAYPILGATPLDERLIYLRTMLVAMESLKNGVTCVTDDVLGSPNQALSQLGAVVQAYDDAGMRATVSGHIMDRNFLDTIPYSREFVPQALQDEVARLELCSADEYLQFAKAAHAEFHDRAGRIRFMVAPSAPQRCTEALMLGANELARQWQVPFHTHILETKVQACTGPALYGRGLVPYMRDLGLLHSGVTIAHSVWVSDEDISMLGEAGVSIVHNAISNQKLASGIAPIRKLLSAGVNVALGTDGICSNDSARMFDVLKAAALMHKVSSPDGRDWIDATETLNAGTLAGARSAGIEHLTGSLEVGKRADLMILDMRTANFTPLNDIRNHLVYCENGSSVRTVMVNGEIVVQDGELCRVDEAQLLAELRELMPEFLAAHRKIEALNRQFAPYFQAVYRRCHEADVGVRRLLA